MFEAGRSARLGGEPGIYGYIFDLAGLVSWPAARRRGSGSPENQKGPPGALVNKVLIPQARKIG
jgi:hypothetical protein